MKKIQLSAKKRSVLGKKVRHLRKTGVIPANVYGKSVQSLAIEVPQHQFEKTYEDAGETGLIELTIEGSKTPRHVLIHNVQIHPVTDQLLHADFHEVALKEKLSVSVPITLKGESPIVSQKQGVLIHLMNEVDVEALPTELPEEIVVDITTLTEIGSELKVSDIKTTGSYTIKAEPGQIIVKVNPLEKEEAPAPTPTPVAAEGGEAKEATSGEAKEPAASPQPATEKTQEKKG